LRPESDDVRGNRKHYKNIEAILDPVSGAILLFVFYLIRMAIHGNKPVHSKGKPIKIIIFHKRGIKTISFTLFSFNYSGN